MGVVVVVVAVDWPRLLAVVLALIRLARCERLAQVRLQRLRLELQRKVPARRPHTARLGTRITQGRPW